MKTFRFIGMALLAVVMCVNFTSCSNDDEEQGETYSVEGTWLMQSLKGYIETADNKEILDESYPDLQESKLIITKVSNNKYRFEEHTYNNGTWEEEDDIYPELSGNMFTITPHQLDIFDTAEIKYLDETKLVLEFIGNDYDQEWWRYTCTSIRAK